MTDIDAFDLWWGWAVKPLDSSLTIPADIHEAVMTLLPEERLDRAKVNGLCARVSPLARCVLPAPRTSTAFREQRNRKHRRA
jgi:hypothetical protein